MKTTIKLALGVVFAAVAIGLTTIPDDSAKDPEGSPKGEPCYTEQEVNLLMKANHWNHQQAEDLLKLACSYSDKNNQ